MYIEENIYYKPFVKLVSYLPNSPSLIASAGKSTITPRNIETIVSEINNNDVSKWLTELIRRSHGSPLEHSLYIFEITCSRVASHQLIRHRIASYTQLSQRYSDKYLRKMVYRVAEAVGVEIGETNSYREYVALLSKFLNSEQDFDELLDVVSKAFIIPPSIVRNRDISFLLDLTKSVLKYYELLENGVSYEDARYVLPQCVKTRILASMNARELVEVFLPLRMCSRAQWEIRYIAWSMWKQLVDTHPDIFKYTGPRCINIDLKTSSRTCSLEEYLDKTCKPTIERCPELVSRENILNCISNSCRDPWSGEFLYT